MDTSRLPRPTWAEIDLDAVAHNYGEFRRLLGPDIAVIAALKAHGYGHGLVPVARLLAGLGADILAVGNPYEGVRLREAGVRAPIQVFGSSLPESAHLFARHNLMPTFMNPGDPAAYRAVLGDETPLKVWIKVETGLGRLGVFPEDVIPMLRYMRENTRYAPAGVYTHIGARAQAGGEADRAYCANQWLLFKKLRDEIEAAGFRVPYYQAASTHAVQALPQTWSNCVCLGGGLYTGEGPENPAVRADGRNAFRALRSKLISVKRFAAGSQIGGVALERDSVIGVAPFGLGDGFSGKNRDQDVLIKGVRCRIIGSVSLEHTRIDLTGAPGPSVGDTVTFVGEDGGDQIGVADVCRRTGVSSAQFLTSLNLTTVPYVFFRDGEIADIEIG